MVAATSIADKKKQQADVRKMLSREEEPSLDFAPVKQEIRNVALAKIDDTCWNSRIVIDESSMEFQVLEASIRQNGLKQNIVITPKEQPDEKGREFEIVAGFRRFRVLTRMGSKSIPCIVETYAHPAQRVISNIIENTHRQKLKPFEMASACLELKKLGYKVKHIAHLISYSETHVGGLLNCVENLIPPVMAMFKANADGATLSELFTIARMKAPEQQEAYNNLIHRQQGPTPGAGGEKKPVDVGPKVKKRDAIAGAIGDLARGAESVLVKGEEMFIRDDEERDKLITMLRWTIGELKKYPLVLPPDDVSDLGGNDEEPAGGKRKGRR